MASESILNISFYRFFDWQDFREQRAVFREKCLTLGLKGTIILSPEGINGFLAGPEARVREAMVWMRSLPQLDGQDFKESLSETIPFQKMLVKLKKEIIPLGDPSIRPHEQTGRRLTPEELREWYASGKDFWILDTRNTYEVVEGTFERAIDPGIRTFREFPRKLADLPAEFRDKPGVMFCTGGIRCEKATAVAEKMGFKEVYQLEGGILRYFEKVGAANYAGKCFVFDARVALDGELAPAIDGENDDDGDSTDVA